MTKKIDFTKLMLKDIEGHEVPTDISKTLGNMMYMQGLNIDECELGTAIYHSDGEMEIDDKQAETVRSYAMRLPYVFRCGLLDALKQ